LFDSSKDLFLFYARSDYESPKVVTVDEDAKRVIYDLLNNFADEVIHRTAGIKHTHAWRQLGLTLLTPVLPYLEGIEHLIISPHRNFHSFPFHALYIDHEKGALIDLLAVSYVSAVGPFLLQYGLASVNSNCVLVMGLSPFVSEAKVVASVHSTHAIIDDEAVSDVLREYSDKPLDLIHLSCHGSLSSDPLSSALILSDGKFSVRDWLELTLRTNFVALSACDLACSESLGADELAGFAQAIALCGSRAALLSQWSANAYTTEILMANFHRLYRDRASSSLAELLRQSSIALRDSKLSNAFCDSIDYADPFYWAPFCIYGKWHI
jgi:CHAT domain-containing protein